MSAARQELGVLGERIAARWLSARGWRVLAHRYRSGHRDIDLVASRSEPERVVAFVEVKTREGRRCGDPVEAVGWRKRRDLARSARVWIDRNGWVGAAYRFDVVAVLLDGERVRIRHVQNAFRLPDRA